LDTTEYFDTYTIHIQWSCAGLIAEKSHVWRSSGPFASSLEHLINYLVFNHYFASVSVADDGLIPNWVDVSLLLRSLKSCCLLILYRLKINSSACSDGYPPIMYNLFCAQLGPTQPPSLSEAIN